jgi:energy-coupling factor transporter ATP-binding protein EcfA2
VKIPKETKKFERHSVPALISEHTHITLVVGRKGSGKSHLVCKLLKTIYCNIYDRIIFVSPTFEAQLDLWGTLDPQGITVYPQLTDELLTRLLVEQIKTKQKTLLLLDDNGEDFKKIAPSIVNKLVSNSRHINLSIIGLFQKLTQAPTILRGNADCIIAFAASSYLERDCLWREISTVSKTDFQRIFNEATEKHDHGFLCSSIGRDGSLKFYMSDFTTEIK